MIVPVIARMNSIRKIRPIRARIFPKQPKPRLSSLLRGADISVIINPMRGVNIRLRIKAHPKPIFLFLPIRPTITANNEPESSPNTIIGIISKIFKSPLCPLFQKCVRLGASHLLQYRSVLIST